MLRGVREILEEDDAESVQSQNFNMAKYVKDFDSQKNFEDSDYSDRQQFIDMC